MNPFSSFFGGSFFGNDPFFQQRMPTPMESMFGDPFGPQMRRVPERNLPDDFQTGADTSSPLGPYYEEPEDHSESRPRPVPVHVVSSRKTGPNGVIIEEVDDIHDENLDLEDSGPGSKGQGGSSLRIVDLDEENDESAGDGGHGEEHGSGHIDDPVDGHVGLSGHSGPSAPFQERSLNSFPASEDPFFQSTFHTTGQPGFSSSTTYTSSYSTGPGGRTVFMEETSSSDGRRQRTKRTRGVGERSVHVISERDDRGVERQEELYDGLDPSEREAFDAEWESETGNPRRRPPQPSRRIGYR